MRILLCLLVLLVAGSALAVGISRVGTGTSVTVGTTATLLDDASVDDSSSRYFQVCNTEPGAEQTVYIGDSAVSTSSSMPLGIGECWSTGNVKLNAGAKVYAIASVSQAVRVQETLER